MDCLTYRALLSGSCIIVLLCGVCIIVDESTKIENSLWLMFAFPLCVYMWMFVGGYKRVQLYMYYCHDQGLLSLVRERMCACIHAC